MSRPTKVVVQRQVWTSRWRSFKDGIAAPNAKGVYEIKCVDVDGVSMQIPRTACIDKEGVLYIGETHERGLKKRLEDFWRYVQSEKGKHSGAKTYMDYRFGKKFPSKQLEFRWTLTEKPSIVEQELLDMYVRKYLDKPPLNLSIKRKKNG